MLAPGPEYVDGGFVREFMLLLDGISVGEQSIQDRERSPLLCMLKGFQVFANA